MRVLVILVAVSCCSAQLVLPYSAPWVLPYANLIADPKTETEVKPVALHTPYLHHPLTYPLATTYGYPLGHHLPYVVAADATLKATEFPYIYEKVAAEEPAAEEAAVEEARRRRRSVQVPLPYLHAVPTTKEITVETKQFEPINAATPADTTKIELTTKEHEVSIPAVKYVQPHVNLKPVTYTAISPAVVSPTVYHAAAYPAIHAVHPFTYTHLAQAPVIKIDE
ncbi:hypothetical protein SK128_007349 [Halocaridina rubra]|uniref:Cuticle protein n=1 Tax=Halocaridina rubra TaxID=373956 RepID=A0AAN8WBV6_HALRR